MNRYGTHPLWVWVSPDCWLCFEAAKVPRLLPAPSVGVVYRVSARAAVGFLSAQRNDSQPLQASLSLPKPPLLSGGARVPLQPHLQPQPLSPLPTWPLRLPFSPGLRLLDRGGGAESGAPHRPRQPPALAPLRLAAESTSHVVGRPAPLGRPGLAPPLPPSGPASLWSLVCSAWLSASFAEQVHELSERSRPLPNRVAAGLVAFPLRCLPKPMCSGPLRRTVAV